LRRQGARFYREFRDAGDRDPAGLRSLESATGLPLLRLEEQWKAWVRDLAWNE